MKLQSSQDKKKILKNKNQINYKRKENQNGIGLFISDTWRIKPMCSSLRIKERALRTERNGHQQNVHMHNEKSVVSCGLHI